jgi:hypothetical protein
MRHATGCGFAPQRGNPCRNAAPRRSENCRVVAIFVFFAASDDSGKLYALGNGLAPWQT